MALKADIGSLIAGVLALIGIILMFVGGGASLIGLVLIMLLPASIIMGHLSEEGGALGIVGLSLGWLTFLLLIIKVIVFMTQLSGFRGFGLPF